MYRIILLLILTSLSITTYGQKVVMSTASVTDSVRVKINRSKKVETVDGVDMFAAKDIVQNLTNAPNFSILLSAMRSAGLIGTFKSRGPITIFAPTNSAFQKLPPGKLDTLLKPTHNLDLCSVLTSHAIAGKLNRRSITRKIHSGKGTALLITLAGSTLKATLDENDNIILTDENGNKSIIEIDDIEQSNGMIHVINGILIPKVRAI